MKRILTATALCLLAASAAAADADGAYFSQRPEGCRDFRRVVGSGERTAAAANIRGWIAGYLTAYNRQTPETYDVLGISTFEDALRFIEGHCKDNPFDTLNVAMEALTENLAPKRYQTRRQAGR